MGRFADEMTRLCGDISASRETRKRFIKNNRRNVAAMRSGFSQSQAEMAVKAATERRAFIANLKGAVADLKREFITTLKGTVSEMRQEFAADIEGARQAWAGK